MTLVIIQVFAWVQFASAAHIHESHSDNQHNAHYEHHDDGHNNHKEAPDDHPAPTCSVCIVTAHEDLVLDWSAGEPSFDGPDVTDNPSAIITYAPAFLEHISNPETFTKNQARRTGQQKFQLLKPSRAPPLSA